MIVVAKGSILRRMILSHCTSRSDTTRERSIAHALYQGLTKIIHFLWIVGSERSRDRRSIVHPAFQFELANHFVAIRLGAALGHLIAPNRRLVQVMHKVDSQLDQEISLRLIVIRIIQPIIKVCLRSKPQHGMGSVLYPKGLFPLFHHNGAKRNATQDKALFPYQISLGQRG